MEDLLPLPFKPGVALAPMTEVEISVSCRGIKDVDTFSKTDPIVVLSVVDPVSKLWKEHGRTEIIWNNLNPDFVEKFNVHFYFQESQKMKFEVYHVKSEKVTDLSKHTFVGRMECTLGEIVTSGILTRPLVGLPKNKGEIIVSSEELRSCKERITLQFRAHGLDKKDFFGLSDPFLTFSKSTKDKRFTLTHKTEVKKNTLNPRWKEFTISVKSLCNGDHDRDIKVDCYDWNFTGNHDYIGSFMTTVGRLMNGACDQNKYECVDASQMRTRRGYKNSGTVELMSCKVEKTPTFLDYIKGGGTNIHCTFAVNFSSSNGDPRNPTSLHYMGDPDKLNPYETAIKSVGEIIQDYVNDKKFCALGFGARLPEGTDVRHEFAMNGNPHSPHCDSIAEVLKAYKHTLQSVQLYGPTKLAPCVHHVTKFAAKSEKGQDYYILIILTDGNITDMPETTEAIVNAASLPMSIIIVGLGDSDFKEMNILDGDDVRLRYQEREAERDIVQFVPLRNFLGNSDQDTGATQARLAYEVLEEIPEQFLSYMKKENVAPGSPRRASVRSVDPTFPLRPLPDIKRLH